MKLFHLISAIFPLFSLFQVQSLDSEAVSGFDFNSYHDYHDFDWYITSVARRYPHISTLKTIGTSREGRRILGLKIGLPSNFSKPAVWIDGGNHAREWPAFHVCVFFIDRLLSGYGKIPKFTEYINKLNIYIFPVLNPDGFIFSRTSTKDSVRQWRKNMAPDNCTGYINFKREPTCCNGVDLNRNWDVGFSQDNYPFNNPCSDEFQGPFPFSEPETIAMRDFVLTNEINGKVKAMVSLHTHGQLFILPYNFKRRTYPEDYDDLEKVALRAAAAIASYRDTQYKVGTAADMLGPATGGTIDWIKMNTLIKYVYVLELPPELSTWFAFQMKPHWLIPTAKETWQGVEVIIRQVLREFPQA
ncbi:unnamed protein product [Bursaphelenchus xylophilus]|nr:unnamed protein product [Bursaphelenchus xylophilus]CAG9083970.1 unnamed protein product [Bursaphelenchus xylophilus]